MISDLMTAQLRQLLTLCHREWITLDQQRGEAAIPGGGVEPDEYTDLLVRQEMLTGTMTRIREELGRRT